MPWKASLATSIVEDPPIPAGSPPVCAGAGTMPEGIEVAMVFRLDAGLRPLRAERCGRRLAVFAMRRPQEMSDEQDPEIRG